VLSTKNFNPAAKTAAEWTGSVLTDEAREYAVGLPHTLVAGDFTLVHGSPRDPTWEYLDDDAEALQNLPYLKTSHCVHGHTHVPKSLFVGDRNFSDLPRFEDVIVLMAGNWFVNPGSVGQPRDGDPRASYALLDDASMIVHFYRFEYPVGVTQALMREAGLPAMLWQRLSYGL
jgi:diadenosine tetraphosphatase ApaH/serine/threonine PP2A family protein phosphatase